MSQIFERARRYYLGNYFCYKRDRCEILAVKEVGTVQDWQVKCLVQRPDGSQLWVRGWDLELWATADPS